MVIVCDCEGLLEGQPRGRDTFVHCTQCSRTYPIKEAKQILKLLQLAGRETDNDGKPANEHVRRMALNKVAYRLAALKLRVIDEAELRPVVPPPPPVQPYRSSTWPFAGVTTSTTTYGNSPFGRIVINVVVT